MGDLLFTIFITVILIPIFITFSNNVMEKLAHAFDVVSKALIIQG